MKHIEDFKTIDVNASENDIDKALHDENFDGLVITEDGEPKAVIISASEYEELKKQEKMILDELKK